MERSRRPSAGFLGCHLHELHRRAQAKCSRAMNKALIERHEAVNVGRECPMKRIGKVDFDKLNVSGGSIALGHPFAATGARQISQALHELKRRGGQFALCTACAAGGLGAAMVLEAA